MFVLPHMCAMAVAMAWLQVGELVVQERKIITTEEYTYLVGGGETPVVNGMAVGLYLTGMDRVDRPYPEWVPFAETW